MIKIALWDRALRSIKSSLREGVFWFVLSSILPPMIAILTGPLLLRKVGLEEYAVLSLATYFFNLVTGYSDFGSGVYLLTIYSKNSPNRHAVLGNATALKVGLLSVFFCALFFFFHQYPRKDDLYSLLGVFMVTLLLPSVYVEWYFIARRRYFRLFLARLVLMVLQTSLILIWFYSKWKNPLFIPSLTLISGMAGSLCLIWFLGRSRILRGIKTLGSISLQTLRSLFLQLAPMAASLLITPYLLAYALPWYAFTCSDKKLVGAFSIAYRLIIGMSSLVAPLVVYSIPKNAGSNNLPPFFKTLGFSLLASMGFWLFGVPVLWFYFHLSKVNPALFPHAFRVFSILLAAVFFICLRTPYVGQRLIHGQYRAYFLILLISCAPVMAVSWVGGKNISPDWVPWLACLPDFFTTVGFVGYNRIRSLGSQLRAGISPL